VYCALPALLAACRFRFYCPCFCMFRPPHCSTLFPYTTLFRSFVGYPRFPAPVEFIAAVIAYYVHPVNIQTACLIMEGAINSTGRSEERFSRNAETELVCRLLLEKKKTAREHASGLPSTTITLR